jgi:hypothetical protein
MNDNNNIFNFYNADTCGDYYCVCHVYEDVTNVMNIQEEIRNENSDLKDWMNLDLNVIKNGHKRLKGVIEEYFNS